MWVFLLVAGSMVEALPLVTTGKGTQLAGSFLGSGFYLTPPCEPRFLHAVVRTRFQFIVFAGVAVEVNDLLFGFADFRHRSLSNANF